MAFLIDLHAITDRFRAPVAMPEPPKRALPEPGDVVFMNLPADGNPNRPGAHPRYGLVLKVQASGREGSEPQLLVIPAEISKTTVTRAYEFAIDDKREANAAGLPDVARFDLKNAVIVGWSPKWAENGKNGPLIGEIGDAAFDKLIVARRALIHAASVKTEQAQDKAMKAIKDAPKPAYNPEIAKLHRNKGQEREIWS